MAFPYIDTNSVRVLPFANRTPFNTFDPLFNDFPRFAMLIRTSCVKLIVYSLIAAGRWRRLYSPNPPLRLTVRYELNGWLCPNRSDK